MDAQLLEVSNAMAYDGPVKSRPKRPSKAAVLGQDDDWQGNPHEFKKPCSLMPPAEQHEIELKNLSLRENPPTAPSFSAGVPPASTRVPHT